MIRGVHHIGILVRDARATAERFRTALGLEVTSWEDYGPGQALIGFIPVGGTLLELVQPLGEAGFGVEWLRERGEGLQHVAFQVDDIDAALETLKSRGVELQDDHARPGAANTMIAFLGRGTVEGYMVELVQPPRAPR